MLQLSTEKHWKWLRSALGVVAVNELSGGSAVHKGVDGLHFSCISGFKLNLQFHGG